MSINADSKIIARDVLGVKALAWGEQRQQTMTFADIRRHCRLASYSW